MSNLKIQRLPDSAFRLWVKGLCYCQMHLTDGLIPREALGPMQAKRKDVDALCTPQVEGKAALWERINAIGFRVYNYLKYNDSKAHVEEKREKARKRMDTARSREPTPHVRDPLRESALANTPLTSTSLSGSSGSLEREFEGKPKTGLVVSDAIAQRAADFLEKYASLYSQHRNGAKLLRQRPALDWDRACQLCHTWTDVRLEKMAIIFLTTDEEWVQKTGREFGVFFSKASWCDNRLAEWEATHGPV